ncbi:MAG: PAS domain-containing protein [Methanomicrobiaceae archaeon]|nr:PAS domain-containing protein [Methanomicrobiaceae archaeon]
MTEDKISQNRPGRKALFTGAQLPRETKGSAPCDVSSEFISHCTKVLDDFVSGNIDAKVDIDIADENLKSLATSINRILEDAGKKDDLEEKNKIINNLEEEISALKINAEKIENVLSAEEINSLRSEISTLKEKEENLNKRLNETENKYRQYVQTQEEERDTLVKNAIKKAKEDLEITYESDKHELNAALKDKEAKILKITEELVQEQKNIDLSKSTLYECQKELEETKELFDNSEVTISKLQSEIINLEETCNKKSEEVILGLKQIEALKLRSEIIVQENPMPILLTDISFKILVTNRAYEKMSGITASEIKNMNIRNFEVLEEKGDGLSKILQSHKRSYAEIKIKLPSGIHCLKQYGIPIKNKEGQIKNILIVYNDITKEKDEAEEIKVKINEIEALKKRSEIIVQQNPMPIILLNKNFRIVVTNNAFEKMSGFSRSKLLEMYATDFKITSDNGNKLNSILNSKKQLYNETVIEFPTGSHVLEQYAIPILNEKEELANILIVFNDITALRRREKEIEDLMKKAKEEAICLEESAKDITANMVALAAGDLATKASILENDHLKLLKEKFNETIFAFRTSIEDISEKTNLIEGTSEGLRKNNEDIAHATEKLAQNACDSSDFTRNLTEHFEKISDGISDLSASIEEISSTAQEVMKNTQIVTSEGKCAADIGKEASLKMETVGEISQKSIAEINSLNNEMYKINDIVKVISGIAEQTNMLALNAAIEAARAGEHGRGFSVVAGEVKNLAGESKKATLEIQNLISHIQKNSQNTADSMRQVDEEMRIGIKSTNSAISALNKIVEDIEAASYGMTEISKATETQANETNSFMRSIEIANEMIRENITKIENIAALAEEIAASTQEVGGISDEMYDMSVSLKKAIGKFIL